MNCRFCGKSFNRGFNLRRHESEYCPLQDHNSLIETGSVQSTGMSTKRKYADTDDSTSESDEDQENEHETNPWASLKMEAMTKNMPEFQELTETFTADGLKEEEAKDKAYLTILTKLRKDLQSIYLNRLLWIAQMKKDPVHKQIMKTKDAFANDDNFDPEEDLEAAVDKRKFLMKRLFGDTRSTNTL